jgi:hypothetical protein
MIARCVSLRQRGVTTQKSPFAALLFNHVRNMRATCTIIFQHLMC